MFEIFERYKAVLVLVDVIELQLEVIILAGYVHRNENFSELIFV